VRSCGRAELRALLLTVGKCVVVEHSGELRLRLLLCASLLSQLVRLAAQAVLQVQALAD